MRFTCRSHICLMSAEASLRRMMYGLWNGFDQRLYYFSLNLRDVGPLKATPCFGRNGSVLPRAVRALACRRPGRSRSPVIKAEAADPPTPPHTAPPGSKLPLSVGFLPRRALRRINNLTASFEVAASFCDTRSPEETHWLSSAAPFPWQSQGWHHSLTWGHGVRDTSQGLRLATSASPPDGRSASPRLGPALAKTNLPVSRGLLTHPARTGVGRNMAAHWLPLSGKMVFCLQLERRQTGTSAALHQKKHEKTRKIPFLSLRHSFFNRSTASSCHSSPRVFHQTAKRVSSNQLLYFILKNSHLPLDEAQLRRRTNPFNFLLHLGDLTGF
ncbi:hypothetical protein SKAU_G00374660 [Synaphobranchus kaupii]|uniref:Uncharacterized protein n=1 Tax=Synaphobranchus kaupii TaxID=118154 RepID=A0A9Q1EGQ2_SYNKA|nr:hypothetical protein SKAU_G00374660 [Synaphobranchus kaupii]